jgi:hypothetical protein
MSIGESCVAATGARWRRPTESGEAVEAVEEALQTLGLVPALLTEEEEAQNLPMQLLYIWLPAG